MHDTSGGDLRHVHGLRSGELIVHSSMIGKLLLCVTLITFKIRKAFILIPSWGLGDVDEILGDSQAHSPQC
jgi:hypothetical protein